MLEKVITAAEMSLRLRGDFYDAQSPDSGKITNTAST
jgi:hypothetical protein